MTNKTLSEQLCEVVGLRPYYGIWVDYGDLDVDYRLATNKRKYRLIADVRWQVDNPECLRDLKPEYVPDFMSPATFVQLAELKIKLPDKAPIELMYIVGQEFVAPCREDFLEYLINRLKDHRHYLCVVHAIREHIKAAILAENWNMENAIKIGETEDGN